MTENICDVGLYDVDNKRITDAGAAVIHEKLVDIVKNCEEIIYRDGFDPKLGSHFNQQAHFIMSSLDSGFHEFFEVFEELSETNPHRNDALIIVDKDGNYYQTVEDKTLV